MSIESVRTCWAIVPPWSGLARTGLASGTTDPAMLKSGRPDEAGNTLRALLRRDIKRGSRYVAVRHLLMLTACGFDPPPDLQAQCAELVATCPSRKLAVITDQVDRWVSWRDQIRAASDASRATEPENKA